MGKKKDSKNLVVRNGTAEFLTFAYQSGGNDLEVRVQDGTIWLTPKQMGSLFDTSSENIYMHMKNIFNDGELTAISATKDFLVTAADTDYSPV